MYKFENIYEVYRTHCTLINSQTEDSQKDESSEDDDDIIDFRGLYSRDPSTSTAVGSTSELDKYLSQPRAAYNEDILRWWKERRFEFPILAQMARDLFSVAATSVPSERLFSRASLTIRKHRNRLNTESARYLLCINNWAQL